MPEPSRRVLFVGRCAGVLIAALAWLFGLRLIEDQDVLWHILTGRWVLAHGGPPRTDPFGAVTLGAPWLCVSWLADLFWALGERALSIEGLHLVLAAVPAACVGWAAIRQRRTGALVGALLFVLACWPRFLPRPDVLSVPLTLALVATLRRDDGDWRRRSVFLAALGAAWANIHGSFVLVPAACVAWTAAACITSGRLSWREHVTPCVAALAGTFVNPWGPGLYGLFAPYLRSLGSSLGATGGGGAIDIVEWKPTWTMLGEPGFPVLALALLALSSLVRVLLSGRSGRGQRLALWLLFAGLAWTAVRHVLPFGAVALALLAEPAAPEDEGWWRRLGLEGVRLAEAAATIVVALITGASVLSGAYFTARDLVTRTGVGLHPDRMPVATAAWMRGHVLPDVTLNNFDSGSYLLYALEGTFHPWLDNRMVSPALVSETTAALSSPETLEAYAGERGIRSIVLSHPSPQTATVVPWLVRDPRWRAVFLDATGTVFVRADATVGERSPALPPTRAPGWVAALDRGFDALRRHALPAADLNLAYLALLVGDRTAAEAALGRVLAADPGNVFARTALAGLPPAAPDAPARATPIPPGLLAPGSL